MDPVHIKLGEDKRKELLGYLVEQYDRAKMARSTQIDVKYERWRKIYQAEPASLRRNFPWPGASNIVIPLCQIHVDTMTSKHMGLIMNTFPLTKVIGFPQQLQDSYEKYLNYKAVYQWQYQRLAREMIRGGRISGTSVVKTSWFKEVEPDVSMGEDGIVKHEELTNESPRSRVVPFDDIFVYPIRATRDEDVQIWFHRIRYTREQAMAMTSDEGNGIWDYPWEPGAVNLDGDRTVQVVGLKTALKQPMDLKRDKAATAAGIEPTMLYEVEVVEATLSYPVVPGDKTRYKIVVVFQPELVGDKSGLLDIYHYPTPRNIPIYASYRPNESEDLFYGVSDAQRLAMLQEESSQIHNQRSDNRTIANAPMFKQKRGADGLSGQTQFYPGRIVTVDSMDDFETLGFGQMLDPMMNDEAQVMQLADLVMGAGSLAQGSTEGMMGKRGVYSSQGTMAVISESNDRAGDGVRCVREALSKTLKTAAILQATFQPEDPCIDYFPPKEQENIRAALKYANESLGRLHMMPFEVMSSTAQKNKEIERASIVQMASTLNQYYGQIQPLFHMLLDPNAKNPVLRQMVIEIIKGQTAIARRVLSAWDEQDPNGDLPDIESLIRQLGGDPAKAELGAAPGGANGAPIGRPQLAAFAANGTSALQNAGVPPTGSGPM